jgi:hypothetical protein
MSNHISRVLGDANGQARYVYYENESGRRAAAHQLPELLKRPQD